MWEAAEIDTIFNFRGAANQPIFFLIFLAEFEWLAHLTLSWRRPLSYRNQSIDLLPKSMDWSLYDNGFRHERVKDALLACFCTHFFSFFKPKNNKTTSTYYFVMFIKNEKILNKIFFYLHYLQCKNLYKENSLSKRKLVGTFK